MKKIGTISSAVGLIFLGIWLIVKRLFPEKGALLFKFWPVIIIILGIELIVYLSSKNKDKKLGFNFLIIIIIIIYICISIVQSLSPKVSKGIKIIKNNIDSISSNSAGITFNDTDLDNYKKIDFTQTIKSKSKNIDFDFSNADLSIKKSPDNNIKLELRVYTKKSFNISDKVLNYDFNKNLVNNDDECGINFKDQYIAKIEGVVYIPDGVAFSLNGNNMKIDSDISLRNVSYKVEGNNEDINLRSGLQLTLNYNNGNINISDINTVDIEGNNGSVSLNGDIQNAIVKLDNGKVSLDNKICKNVDIDTKLGAVKIDTKDSNINVNFDIGMGYCSLNGDKRVNSGMIKKLGTGEDTLKVHVGTGTIDAFAK